MKVYVLSNTYDDSIEGVFTEAGKRAKEEKLLKDAIEARDRAISRLNEEISEYKEMRQPIIERAESLLTEEAQAKQVDSGGKFKLIRKERKQLLRRAEQITHKIHALEYRIMEYQALLKSGLLCEFDRGHYWDEYYLEGDI